MTFEERRKFPRKAVSQPMQVFDENRCIVLGYLVDISMEGLMLICPEIVKVNRVFQLQVKLPEPLGLGEAVSFGAESLWCEPSQESGRDWAGFQIIDIHRDEAEKIRRLVDDVL